MNDFSYKIDETNEVVSIVLSGKMDTKMANALIDEVKLEDLNSHTVELDLSKLEYISSSGLRFILMLQNYVDDYDDGQLKIIGCSDMVFEVLKIAGFASFLSIE